MTSLMIAIYFGSSEVVKTEIVDILLRRGADVNITESIYTTETVFISITIIILLCSTMTHH